VLILKICFVKKSFQNVKIHFSGQTLKPFELKNRKQLNISILFFSGKYYSKTPNTTAI
jgi:hypothetical protein